MLIMLIRVLCHQRVLVGPVCHSFCGAMLCTTAAYAVVRWLHVCLSVTSAYYVETAKDTTIVTMEFE